MIEVFATNVQDEKEAEEAVSLLISHMPGSEINFDLDDCDSILRIKAFSIEVAVIERLMQENGFLCRVLD